MAASVWTVSLLLLTAAAAVWWNRPRDGTQTNRIQISLLYLMTWTPYSNIFTFCGFVPRLLISAHVIKLHWWKKRKVAMKGKRRDAEIQTCCMSRTWCADNWVKTRKRFVPYRALCFCIQRHNVVGCPAAGERRKENTDLGFESRKWCFLPNSVVFIFFVEPQRDEMLCLGQKKGKLQPLSWFWAVADTRWLKCIYFSEEWIN